MKTIICMTISLSIALGVIGFNCWNIRQHELDEQEKAQNETQYYLANGY